MKNIRREDWESLEPTVYGWGINDVNYKVTLYEVIDGKSKQVWVCPYYRDWRSLILRCYSGVENIKFITYKDCTICEEWKYLSNFIKWVDSQPNRDWRNCSPDKDLLIIRNKHYSPETVVYIPSKLNKFVLDSAAKRGDCMLGVVFKEDNCAQYRAECQDPSKVNKKHLGSFHTELEAHLAWQAKKHEYACQLADLQQDHRVAKVLRDRYSPDKDWTKA